MPLFFLLCMLRLSFVIGKNVFFFFLLIIKEEEGNEIRKGERSCSGR